MDLIYTNSDYEWQGVIDGYDLDLAFGDDENDFQLTVPVGVEVERGSLAFFPYTEYGGVIDEKGFSNKDGAPKVTYKGRTWQGVMAKQVVRPNKGQDHLTMTGDVNDIISSLITRQNVSDLFEAQPPCGVSTTYRFYRYIDMYSGIRMMLDSVGMRLDVERGDGKVMLGAVQSDVVIDDTIDSQRFKFEAWNNMRPVNHLVCLGGDELAARTVVELYMDGSGNVSRKQTFFGIDNVEEAYDYGNAEDTDRLVEGGTERLKEYYRQANSCDLSLPEGYEYHIGDMVGVMATEVEFDIVATVSKKILSVRGENGIMKVQYEVGKVSASNQAPTDAR